MPPKQKLQARSADPVTGENQTDPDQSMVSYSAIDMTERVTLRDIAAEANLHVTSVSMALRNHPRISKATRERVKKLAEKMGYRNDALLSALCRYRSNPKGHSALAWISIYPSKTIQNVSLYAAYLEGAKQRAKSLGFGLLEFYDVLCEDLSVERIHSILQARNIHGVLLPPWPQSKWLDLRWNEISAVAFGHSITHRKVHMVAPNQYTSMQTMINELRALGHKRIGMFLSIELDNRCNNNWQAAYWVDYHRQPATQQVSPLMYENIIDAQKQLPLWLKQERVDAVIIVGNVSTPINWPKGIALAYHSISPTETTRAGIDENGLLTGATGVDMLVGMLSRQEIGIPQFPQLLQVEGTWKAGSLRKLKAEKKP